MRAPRQHTPANAIAANPQPVTLEQIDRQATKMSMSEQT